MATHLKFYIVITMGKSAKNWNIYAYLAKYAYLDTPNMVKWGVPKKILQNVVQARCS